MRYICTPSTSDAKAYYLRNQSGGAMNYFRGARIQRGYGLGNLFKSVARFVVPLFKQGAQAVGKKALETGLAVGGDIMAGKNAKQSIKKRGKQALTGITNQGIDTIKRQVGRGRKRAQASTGPPGKRIKRGPQKKSTIHAPATRRKGSPIDTQQNIFD